MFPTLLHIDVNNANLSRGLADELYSAIEGTHPDARGTAYDVARKTGHGGSFTRLINRIVAKPEYADQYAVASKLAGTLARHNYRADPAIDPNYVGEPTEGGEGTEGGEPTDEATEPATEPTPAEVAPAEPATEPTTVEVAPVEAEPTVDATQPTEPAQPTAEPTTEPQPVTLPAKIASKRRSKWNKSNMQEVLGLYGLDYDADATKAELSTLLETVGH